jgi:hypothetical protein
MRAPSIGRVDFLITSALLVSLTSEYDYMGSGSSGCAGGVFGIVAGILSVCVIITLVTDTYGHWLPVLLGIAVGLAAVARINR